MAKEQSRILIVEDNEINVDILVEALSDNYEVSVALDGETALDIVDEADPDIILLDVMMPGMDGYEVCQRLKAAERTRDIPIIFITALTESDDESRGLRLGAIDYLTKPFNTELVRIRVRNHLRLREARKRLKEHNRELEVRVEQRTRELAEAHERLKMIDATRQDYVSVIAHELRTPINGILGISQLAFEEIPDRNKKDELTGLFEKSRWRLENTIDNALHLASLQASGYNLNTEDVDLVEVLQTAFVQTASEVNDAMAALEFQPAVDSAVVSGDRKLLLQAVVTLIRLMVRLARPATIINVEVLKRESDAILKFTAKGTALPPEMITHLFDEYSDSRLYSKVQDLGFAIPLADKTVRSFGGQIYLVNVDHETIALNCLFEQ